MPLWCLSGGHPAAARCFHRRGAYHPPQPYTTNAAVSYLWNHDALARRPHADISAATVCPAWLLRGFFRPGGYALFAGTPTVDLPLRRRLGLSLSRPPSCAPFQPHRQAHDCPATPLSPSGVLFQPHIFAGLWSSFFRCTVSSRQRAGGLGNLELSLLLLHAALIWESC